MSSEVDSFVSNYKAAVLHSTILFIFFHAIHTCIFLVAMYHTVRSTSLIRKRIVLAGVITYFWCSITVIMGFKWKLLDHIFIVKGVLFNLIDIPAGPEIVVDRLAGINVILADLLLVWRCWILYGRNYKLLSALIICLLAEIVAIFGTMDIPELALFCSQQFCYTMPALTNILCTSLILSRLISVNGPRASFKTYGGIIEILVESAVLYSAFFIGLVISFSIDVDSQMDHAFGFIYLFPLMMSYSFTGIAPTLIIARVMAGHSRPDDYWTRTSLPPLGSQSIRVVSARHGTATTSNDVEEARARTRFELDGL